MSVKPPTTFVRGPSIVWIISSGHDASSEVREALEPLKQLLDDQVVVIATVSGDADELPLSEVFPANDPNLCALLLVIERETCGDRRLLAVLEWAISKTAEREDFRLLVHFRACTLDGFLSALTSEQRRVATDLIDTVQVINARDLSQLCADLTQYLEQLDDIRRHSRWRHLRGTAGAMFGRLAIPVQACAFVLAVGMALYVPVWDQDPSVKLLHQHKPLVAIVCGVAFFPLLMLGVFCYSRYGLFLMGMHRAHRGILWAGLFSVCAAPVFAVMIRIGVPSPWVAVGVAVGAIVDVGRRGAWQALRARRSPDPRSVTRSGRLPDALMRQARPSLPPPLACPIMPNPFAQVFISYTRTSPWSVATAHELRDKITATGARCFLDTREIAEGSNWRSYLNTHLGRASVFLCLADRQSLAREWPAAELETALSGKGLTGSPDIIVITGPNLPTTDLDDLVCLPVFRAVLTQPSHITLEGQPHIIPFSEATVPALAAQLRPNVYRSLSVLPAGIAQLVRYVWSVPRGAIMLTSGVVGAAVGNVAILLFIAEWISRLSPDYRFDSAIVLSRHDLLTPLLLFFAVSMGFVARLAAAARFELKGPRATGGYRAHRDATIGLFLMLMTWVPHASALVDWCAFVCCFIGWGEADYSVFAIGLRDPKFIRHVD